MVYSLSKKLAPFKEFESHLAKGFGGDLSPDALRKKRNTIRSQISFRSDTNFLEPNTPFSPLPPTTPITHLSPKRLNIQVVSKKV